MSRLTTAVRHADRYPKPVWLELLTETISTRSDARPPMMRLGQEDWPRYSYVAEVVRVVDGDTIVVNLDLGDGTVRHHRRIRLLGFDAPELFSGENREAGAASRDALAALCPVGSKVCIRTYRDKENLDRLLAWTYADAGGNMLLDVAEAMISGGHGTRA